MCGQDSNDEMTQMRPRAQHNRTASVWQCFIGCRHKFDQQIARRRVEQGLRLYNKNKQKAAILKWHSALKQMRKRNDRFILLGYLYHAYMGFGKYRQCLEFAHAQLTIAEEMDSPNFRAEAYLNLAKVDERMGNLERALSYAKHSLYNECDHCHTAALVQITLGSLHLELATFCKALRAFQQAHTIARRIQDRSLELQIYMRLSELFGRLQDADKSATYASKAYNLCKTLHVNELNSRYHRAALLQMACALRKQGELGDAHDYCSEATRLALVSGDQPCYAKSIRIMGDIYRKKMEIGNAYRQYESAMNSAFSMGDRLCQIEAMDGAAKCLEVLRAQRKICNCRPLEFNNKLLQTASRIGAKLMMRAIRIRLCNIYESLGDSEQLDQHEKEIQNLQEELEMICGACDNAFGFEADSLEALPCAHILHARCLYDMLNSRDRKTNRTCPDCDKIVSSTLYLQDYDKPSTISLEASFFR
ncbi:43 kDa receptor-associated protein of the synapse homolog isoform X2 [Planococcus citri]